MTKIGLSLVSLRARCLLGGVALMSATLVCGPAHAESTDSPLPLFAGPAVTRSGGTDFSAARAASEQAFVDALPGARARAALDHAQFLISWMMLPEALSYVDFAANALEARGELADRIQAYRAMLALLSQPGMQPETVAFPDSWQNDLVWPIVAEIHNGAEVDASRILQALVAHERHSGPVVSRIVPILFDAALNVGDYRLARDVLDVARVRTDLPGSARMLLMRGRLAQAEGDRQTAFDLYAWAAESRDRAAAEARLALADLALEDPGQSIREHVRDLLVDGIRQWRGDDLALALLTRLAQVAEELGDLETAIITMSFIEEDHPGTREADLAAERIAVILTHLSDAIGSDALPLGRTLPIVRHIEPYMSRHVERAVVRGALAAQFDREGLTLAAQAEYADIWDSLLGPDRRALPPALLDRLVLEQSKRLMRESNPAAAVSIIAQRPVQMDASLDPEFAKIEMVVTGSLERITATSPGVSLEVAREALARDMDTLALTEFQRAGILPLVDGINAARLAAEQGDADSAAFLRVLPEERRELLLRLAAARVAKAPVVSPLSVESAQNTLEQAGDTLSAVTDLMNAEDTGQ